MASDSIIGQIRGDNVGGKWQFWVTQQRDLWVDIRGDVHRITEMDREHCLNVLQFLYEHHHKDIYPARKNLLVQALRDRITETA